jgi:hypothetical protein
MLQHLRGWIDYDRPTLHLLQIKERIEYFEKRVRLVVINPLRRILDNEVHIAVDSSALLVFGVSVCCAIEATGKFLNGGQGKNVERFHAFLNKYMAQDYQSKKVGDMNYGDVLWKHFRNGLSHGFAVCHGGFEGNRGEPYFAVKQISGKDSLMVNPYLLFDDYVVGFGRYLSDLRGCQAKDLLSLDFDKIFDEVFIQGK